VGHASGVEHSFGSVFVLFVKDDLFVVESSVVVAHIGLMEGFRLVVSLSVGGSELIGVLVPLGAPAGAVPVLAIHGVAGAELLECLLLKVVVFKSGSGGVAVLGDILGETEVLRRVEFQGWVAVTKVGVIVDLGLIEAGTGSSLLVVCGVVGRVGEVPRLGAEAAGSGLAGRVVLGDKISIESKVTVTRQLDSKIMNMLCLTYPVVEKGFFATSITASRKTDLDCSVIVLPKWVF
jgi:hypothetical protein